MGAYRFSLAPSNQAAEAMIGRYTYEYDSGYGMTMYLYIFWHTKQKRYIWK